MAEEFVAAKKKAKGHPIIIIIASAKVTSWEGTINKIRQIEIANAASTKFYMNYKDPRVTTIRKMYGIHYFIHQIFYNSYGLLLIQLPITG